MMPFTAHGHEGTNWHISHERFLVREPLLSLNLGKVACS